MGGRGRRHVAAQRQVILELIEESVRAGARQEKACEILGLSSRTLQRWRTQEGGKDRRRGPRHCSNKLTAEERERVLKVVRSPEFCDMTPHQIVPRLADRKDYIASEATIYRILREENELAHRSRAKPARSKAPTARVATGPCQVWSWDITYLRSPVNGMFYYLYMILDIWSRKIVAWQVHEKECNKLAAELFEWACHEQSADPTTLVLHADNGSPMKGSTMLATLQRLGVVASFSRPRVSDDNPFSEALFRTLKYRPDYLGTKPYASLQHAQAWVRRFVAWYNTQHLHSALRFVTPDDRHRGRDQAILERRRQVYRQAKKHHPDRWSGATRNWTPIREVVLNPSKTLKNEIVGQKKAA